MYISAVRVAYIFQTMIKRGCCCHQDSQMPQSSQLARLIDIRNRAKKNVDLPTDRARKLGHPISENNKGASDAEYTSSEG